MKILHWAESFYPRIGGAEVFVANLATSQVEQGHECLVLTSALPDEPARAERCGVAIHRLGFHRALLSRSLAAIRDVRQQVEDLIARFAPDVLHLHTSQASAFFFTRLAESTCPPSIYTAHDGVLAGIHDAGPTLLGAILARADRVVAPSGFVRDALRAGWPEPRTEIRLISGSLPDPGAPAAQQPDPQAGPHTVFAAGRLVREKGFDVFLAALGRAVPVAPGLRAVVAGDGPEAANLRACAESTGLADRVRFAGWVPPQEVMAMVRTASLVVVPSRWQEPFGLVALQSMQAGVPAIVTRVGGLPEIIEDGHTGLVVEPEDPDALARAIVDLLGDPARRGRMGRAGLLRAAGSFGWQGCVDAYRALYDEVLAPGAEP